MSKTITYTFSTPADSSFTVTIGDTPSTYNIDGSNYQGYAITGISGTFNGQTINALLGPGGQVGFDLGGAGAYDNTVFVNDTQGVYGSIDGIDSDGIGFATSTGDHYGIYRYGSGFEYESGGTDQQTTVLQSTNEPQVVACYAAGTLIRTARGDVAVEALEVGDQVITASGVMRPIRWLGHRTIDCRKHPRRHEVMPVRIAAQALGPNKPARDLYVSPGHAICVDIDGEVLIQAAALVNGATIRQVDVDSITYWHVELDSHEILLAEGLPAESFLDMSNRGFFAEAAVVDLAAGPDAVARTHADYCRPFHVGGALVEMVRARLSARAEQLGWTLDQSSPFADLHLVVDGTRIEPASRGLSARFIVPAGASDVWLASTSVRPRDVGVNEDGRALGIWLSGLTIEDGFDARVIALDDPLLGLGLHALEADGRRWTAGRARLPAALWDGREHDVSLRVDLAGWALPRWVAPGEGDVVRVRATA